MTQLVRRNFPVSTFVDRFFDDSFFARPSRATNGDGATWVPAVDLSQSDEKFVLRADLPGLSKDDVNLTVEDSTLTLSGDRPLGKKEDGEAFNRVERTFGTFTRSFTLPSNVDGTAVSATFTDGVLTVDIPKLEEAKSRQIAIG